MYDAFLTLYMRISMKKREVVGANKIEGSSRGYEWTNQHRHSGRAVGGNEELLLLLLLLLLLFRGMKVDAAKIHK